jgi:hypothetical protein
VDLVSQALQSAFSAGKAENKPWTFCPECGSDKQQRGAGMEPSHRHCLGCGQEWFTDLDYTDAVRSNLSRAASLRQEQPPEPATGQEKE